METRTFRLKDEQRISAMGISNGEQCWSCMLVGSVSLLRGEDFLGATETCQSPLELLRDGLKVTSEGAVL